MRAMREMSESVRSAPGLQEPSQQTQEDDAQLMKKSPAERAPLQSDDLLQVDSDLSDFSDTTSSIDDRTTIISTIKNYKYENGRRYHSFRDGEYLLPNDDREQDRLDLGHHIFKLILGGDLYRSPIPNPESVLDLGTGTGLWAIDLAEQFPGAEVLGTDLSPIQPPWSPSNCRFEVDDVESDWLYGHYSFDFIHARAISGSIRDWDRLFSQAMESLRPGGWIEVQEYETLALSDDNTIELAPNLKMWQEKLNEASELFGKPFMDSSGHKSRMEKAGFVGVTDDVYKVPMGPWPKDKRMKEIGKFELYQMLEAVEPYSLAVFTRVLKWTPEQTRDLIDKVKADLCNSKVHIYSRFHFIYGQKPETN